MRILKERLKRDIEMLMFKDIDIYDEDFACKLISIIRMLTDGDKYFFGLRVRIVIF